MCRDRASQEGFLVYQKIQPNKCFYFHTMDFNGEYIDMAVTVDRNDPTPTGGYFVNLQPKFSPGQATQHWLFDDKTFAFHS